MPTLQYKESRVCECGYSTMTISYWSKHQKTCKLKKELINEQRIAYLEKQLGIKDMQLLEQREELKEQREENREQREEIREQREEIKMFEQLLAERFVELKEELKQIRKRKNRYADQASKRVHRTEPERRKIAMRQNWMCAGKECLLPEGRELEEFDIDHIVPLSLGGSEDSSNLQALCPGCHRKKTDQERVGHTPNVA